MTQEEITQAFKGRIRFKSSVIQTTVVDALDGKLTFKELSDKIESLCRDFFTAGILLSESSQSAVSPPDNISQQDFDDWWKLYDLKVGKEKCLQKWTKMSAKDRNACIAATPAYVASTPDKQFRKRPLTYLNQKAWNDEIIIRNNPDNQRQQRLEEAAQRIAEYTKDSK